MKCGSLFSGAFLSRKGSELAITVNPSLLHLAKPSAHEAERPVRRLGESRCYSQSQVTVTVALKMVLSVEGIPRQ